LIDNTDQLEDLLSEPTPPVLEAVQNCPGDWIVLGAAGKMGPTLTRMIRRALDVCQSDSQVIGVSRFSQPGSRRHLEQHNIKTIQCDLLDTDALNQLPDAANVVYMPALKFGAEDQRGLAWAVNSYLPGLVGHKYAGKRILAFSTGNIYGHVNVATGGSTEQDDPDPKGEYAMSCLGRERVFEYAAALYDCAVTIIRLNYACELRYGVLVDIAQSIWNEQPIDVTMGHFNTIWQGDANAMSIAAIAQANPDDPPFVLNVTGPEILSITDIAQQFGELLDKPVNLTASPASDALLNDASQAIDLYGQPRVDVPQLMQWIAHWIKSDGVLLDKPTHFQVRDGRF